MIVAVVAMLGIGSAANADSVEGVIGLDIDNPGAFVSAVDALFESGAMDGFQLTLWVNTFDGRNPASHTIVASYESYEEMDRLTQQRIEHRGWLQFILAIGDLSTTTSSGLAVEQSAHGSMEPGHRAGAAFIMTVKDPAAYAAAFDKLTKATGNPGSIRLMELRYGGEGATHAVVLSAPNGATLNEFLDEMRSGDAYAAFVAEVGDIRMIRTVNSYALRKRWGD